MTLKKYNPTTSSQRGLVLVDYSGLWKGKPFKKLTSGKKKHRGSKPWTHYDAPSRGWS